MAEHDGDAERLAEDLGVMPPGRHFEPPVGSASQRVPLPREVRRPTETLSPGIVGQSEVQRYIDHLLAEIAVKAGYAASLEVAVRGGRSEIAELRAYVSHLESEIDQLRREHGDATARLATTRHRLADIAYSRMQRLPWLLGGLRRVAAMVRARRAAARSKSGTPAR